MVAPFIKHERKRPNTTIPVIASNLTAHHWFITNPDYEPLGDKEGRIFVFTNKEKAESFADEHSEVLGGYCMIVGMGDEKWKLFQSCEEWVLVEDE